MILSTNASRAAEKSVGGSDVNVRGRGASGSMYADKQRGGDPAAGPNFKISLRHVADFPVVPRPSVTTIFVCPVVFWPLLETRL